MASKKKENRAPFEYKGADNKHVRIFDSMFTSPAFMALTPEAKLLYVYIKREYKGAYTPGFKVKLPYTDIVKYAGIRKATIKRLLQELSIMKFIEIEQVGGSARVTNVYKLIDGWTGLTESEARENAIKLKKARKQISTNKHNSNPATYGIYISGTTGLPSNKKEVEEQNPVKSIDIPTKRSLNKRITNGTTGLPLKSVNSN